MKRMLFALAWSFHHRSVRGAVCLAAAELKSNPNIAVSILAAHTPELVAVSNDNVTQRRASSFAGFWGL